MFNSKAKNPFEESSTGANTIIGAGTSITGDIVSTGDIRVDGMLKGNLTAKGKVLVGPEAVIEGNVMGQQADILGKVVGIVNVKELLYLRGKANLEGNIFALKLQVEPTVTFNGQCHMGANVVELNAENASVVNQ